MSEPEPLSVDDALDRLVNQFSDAMAFFRELIQNAIDAGSDEVEVDFEHRDGMLIVRVDDWGAGMSREIIESRLTRLFSSSKDGDRTKIGKFGIGFVSVFAPKPRAVLVQTGRGLEQLRPDPREIPERGREREPPTRVWIVEHQVGARPSETIIGNDMRVDVYASQPLITRVCAEPSATGLAWALLAVYAHINAVTVNITNEHERQFQQRLADALLDGSLALLQPEMG